MNAGGFYMRGQMYVWRRTGLLRLMPVVGDEFGEVIAQATPVISLKDRARMLETQGHVVQVDEVDIIGGETEAKA